MATPDMDSMASRYVHRGVTSVFIYTREAHPGERIPFHGKVEDKRARAQEFRDEVGVKRPILIDGIDGTVHRDYGLLPNMAWIINPEGIIAYKASWTFAPDIEDAIDEILEYHEGHEKKPSFYSERLARRSNRHKAFREGLERAGPQAIRDFYGK
jgi:hypothetical protein